ncbi:MAG: DUF1801 domain-containing protein [Chloroflexota bacterium]|nr:DUF1801 domain-containing protein [Chloroflexota bacterium]MDE2852979.1 DUF1801 domain-containing protein [Chloroflexota bacterium]MDE2947364.1 DUF1801 domain-containing protein [Chloroflexota bacterium]
MPALNIKTVGGNGSFEDVIAAAPPEIQALAQAARALLADVMPGITEVPWARQKIAGYGVGPKKMSQHFCYIAPFKKHLNLGFMYGARLPDPQNLLEGKGADLRHIKIRSAADLERPGLRVLIEEASRTLPKLQ